MQDGGDMAGRRYKFAAIALALIAAMVLASACGSQEVKAETLEDYFNKDRKELDEVKQTAKDKGFEFSVEENTVKYTYTYEGIELTEEEIKAMAPGLREQMESMAERFTELAQSLSETSGIGGVAVRIVFVDSAGTEVYSAEYTAKSSADSSAS